MAPTSGKVSLSVIIPCQDHARELRRCLCGLRRQEFGGGFEIIVVDSGADDATTRMLGEFAGVALLRSPRRLSAGAARNRGARAAAGEVLAFIDADCVPERGWLDAAVSALQGPAKVVGGPVLDLTPWQPITVVDNLLQFADQGPRRTLVEAGYFPGCNLALRAATFDELGGFPDIPQGEDVMLTREAARRWHGRLHFAPRMRVRHAGRAGLVRLWRHQERLGRTRGGLGLLISRQQQHLGRLRSAQPVVVLKRLVYLVLQTGRWHPARLPVMLLALPIVLLGLAAWSSGYRHGCLAAQRDDAA